MHIWDPSIRTGTDQTSKHRGSISGIIRRVQEGDHVLGDFSLRVQALYKVIVRNCRRSESNETIVVEAFVTVNLYHVHLGIV